MDIQDREELTRPLWVRVVYRLLCGALGAGILGFVGWHWGSAQTMVVGVGVGLAAGLLLGDRIIGGILEAWFWYL